MKKSEAWVLRAILLGATILLLSFAHECGRIHYDNAYLGSHKGLAAAGFAVGGGLGLIAVAMVREGERF